MSTHFENMKERNPLSLDNIIRFIERTKEDMWCTKVVRTEDGKGCVMSHIFDMGGNFFWEMFESMYATTYMIYPVNDGENAGYPQATPKERIIAYLKDLRDGKAKTTQQLMNEYDEERKEELMNKRHVLSIEKSPQECDATDGE